MSFGMKVCMLFCFNVINLAANMYSEQREEARDHARLRNAYFEQVWFFILFFVLPPPEFSSCNQSLLSFKIGTTSVPHW